MRLLFLQTFAETRHR